VAESAEVDLIRAIRPRLGALRQAVTGAVVNALPGHGEGFTSPGVRWREVADWMPADVYADNFRRVASALDAAAIDWWVVSGLDPGRHVIGVADSDRALVMRAITTQPSTAECYVRDPRRPELWVRARRANAAALAKAPVLQVGVPTRCAGLDYDLDYGCDVEFWSIGSGQFVGPRENRAARVLTAAEMTTVRIDVAGRDARTPEVFTRRMVDDITFDIDVVYTWVDGSDPDWREARERTRAEQAGLQFHPGATAEARFHSRDELRYSLRSVAMYAPWVRRIHVVTSGQVPTWLDTSHPRIEVVPHSAIYDDPAQLPTFNSNSIISRLHHVPGLSEHYLYLNDDVFFGSAVTPADFFTPSGLAKVFPSRNRRPFGVPSPEVPTHLNLTHNIRRLLEEELGVTVSRAVWHTPHAQLRSVHEELEQRFAAVYATTWTHPFRHHTDIVADQLHHYYTQIVGRAVVGPLRYAYLGLDDPSTFAAMDRLIRARDQQVFCLNDAPTTGATPIPDEHVEQWLARYFPVRSEFEKH
jgi:hypothetical protein